MSVVPPHRRAVVLLLASLATTAVLLASRRPSPELQLATTAESLTLQELLQDTHSDSVSADSSSQDAEARLAQPQPSSVGAVAPKALVPIIPPEAESVPLSVRVALFSKAPVQTVRVAPGTTCRQLNGPEIPKMRLPLVLRSQPRRPIRCRGGWVQINGSTYRQDVDLIPADQGWLAVNQLDLEHYVASVVGAEMPSSWDLEALKAQAVATRSYAMAHLARPASRDYHLGDTTRWQVFGGEASRSQRTLEAATSTRGIILSYRGGIVESLYAANSQISAEAHGHLGASMSQQGAQDLAAKGLRFNEILGRYYRGASLARLRPDGD